MERESAPIRGARRTHGATDDGARPRARDGAREGRRGPTPRAELARGGALASARSATLALASLCAIALVSARLDAASKGARGREVAVGTTMETTTATATLREDEAVEPELRVGDRSVAYVAKGWNAERRLIGDDKIEAIWEGPAAENEAGEFEATKPKGALLALHGCHHSAKDFFATNTKCTQCRGLAQEMAITRTALNRGYVVLAISSLGTCWSKDIDAPRVQAVLDVFYNDTALSDLPLFRVRCFERWFVCGGDAANANDAEGGGFNYSNRSGTDGVGRRRRRLGGLPADGVLAHAARRANRRVRRGVDHRLPRCWRAHD